MFFAISGFLVTMPVLQDASLETQALPVVITWFVKRAVRMWPAMLASLLMGMIMGDFNADILAFVRRTVTFTTNANLKEYPFCMVTSWSNSVDVRAGATLLLILIIAKRHGVLNKSLLRILLAIAAATLAVIFFQDPDNAGILAIARKNISRLGWPTELQYWVNTTFATGVPLKGTFDAPTGRMLYLATWTRWGPMVVGAMLALRVKESQTNPQPRAWWRVILAAAIFLLAITPPQRATQAPTEYIAPPILPNLFFTVGLRILAAFAWCEVLFSVIVAPTHPSHSPLLYRMLSWKPFGWYAELSYPVYLVHYRIGLSVVMNVLHPTRKHIWGPVLGTEFGLAHLLVCFALTTVISSVVAYFIHRYIEIPVWEQRSKVLHILGLGESAVKKQA